MEFPAGSIVRLKSHPNFMYRVAYHERRPQFGDYDSVTLADGEDVTTLPASLLELAPDPTQYWDYTPEEEEED